MSYILALFTAALAISGMWQHSDWRYWATMWFLCACFIFCGHIGRIAKRLEGG